MSGRQPVINETIAESSYRRIRADIIFGRLPP
ncbi:GntR family transcriptional regulator, partial [Rhizobium leguminosarum]